VRGICAKKTSDAFVSGLRNGMDQTVRRLGCQLHRDRTDDVQRVIVGIAARRPRFGVSDWERELAWIAMGVSGKYTSGHRDTAPSVEGGMMNDSDSGARARGKSRQPRHRNPVTGILLICWAPGAH
jgi:hypothetical protein